MYVQSTNTFLSTENKYHYYTMLHVVCVLLCTIQIIIQLEDIFLGDLHPTALIGRDYGTELPKKSRLKFLLKG